MTTSTANSQNLRAINFHSQHSINLQHLEIGEHTHTSAFYFTNTAHIPRVKMDPVTIVLWVFVALLEIWLVFALAYAGLQKYDGRNFFERFVAALLFRL